MSSRDWQRLSQVLALLLVVLVGAAALIVFLRPGNSAATPSPSNIAVASPTQTDPSTGPSVGPTKTPKPPKTPKPTATATPTPRPTPTPGESESSAPSTSRPSEPGVTIPARSIRFVGLGFDSTAATTPKARQIGFDTDGPGTVTVKLANVLSGAVHLCLQRVGGAQSCVDDNHGPLRGATSAAGKTSWIVSGTAIGGSSAIADVLISFGALHPNVSVTDFRFQGTTNQGFNGAEADLNNNAGTIKVRGTITSAQPWRIRLLDNDVNQVAVQTGTGTQLSFQTDTTTPDLHLSVAGTELLSDVEVFLDATIRWQ